jgi:hypothetical protein
MNVSQIYDEDDKPVEMKIEQLREAANRGGLGVLQMAFPHWLIGIVMLAALGSFVVFAFNQGMKVRREDRNDMGGLPPGGGPGVGA